MFLKYQAGCLIINHYIIYDLYSFDCMIRFNTTTVYNEKHFYLPPLLGHLLDDI